MIYAIHSTLNGIILLSMAKIKGLVVFEDLVLLIFDEKQKVLLSQHFNNWFFVFRIKIYQELSENRLK